MLIGILGASGRTGRRVAEKALAAGHTVRALVRRPGSLELVDERLQVLEGDVHDAAAVARLVSGCDAVVSALGPTKAGFDVCSVSTKHAISAGVKRLVVISGAGLNVPGDAKGPMGRFISWMVRTVSPAVFADKVLQYDLLAASDVEWILVRPPRLHDGPGNGAPRVGLLDAPGSSLSRDDLAAFCLSEAVAPKYTRKAPFLAN